MLLTDVFKSPFKITGMHSYTEPIPKIRINLKTKTMYDTTTKEEVYIVSKMYFDDYVTKFLKIIV